MFVDTADADNNVALRLVVTDAVNEAAIDIPALERRKIDSAAIVHLDRFRANPAVSRRRAVAVHTMVSRYVPQ